MRFFPFMCPLTSSSLPPSVVFPDLSFLVFLFIQLQFRSTKRREVKHRVIQNRALISHKNYGGKMYFVKHNCASRNLCYDEATCSYHIVVAMGFQWSLLALSSLSAWKNLHFFPLVYIHSGS